MRQKLGTVAVVPIAGSSDDIAATLKLFVASTPPLSNSMFFVYNKNVQQHAFNTSAFGGLAQQCFSFDPGGNPLEPQNLSQGDGISVDSLICPSTGWMPGTGVILVHGEGHEYMIVSACDFHYQYRGGLVFYQYVPILVGFSVWHTNLGLPIVGCWHTVGMRLAWVLARVLVHQHVPIIGHANFDANSTYLTIGRPTPWLASWHANSCESIGRPIDLKSMLNP